MAATVLGEAGLPSLDVSRCPGIQEKVKRHVLRIKGEE